MSGTPAADAAPRPDDIASQIDGAPATARDLEAMALANFGHYTSTRVSDGRIKGLPLHVARLRRDCRIVFDTDLDTDRVLELARRAIDDRTGEFGLRITVFDPALGVRRVSGEARPRIMVTLRPADLTPPAPITAKSFPFVRDTAVVKHIGLFSQFHYRRQASLAGFDDAIFVERDARVSEGATWNLGFVHPDDSVVWPDAPVLPGVTMLLLQRLYPAMRSAPVHLGNLGTMRAAFATNASFGVRPISRIDGFEYPESDPVIDRLRRAYADLPGDTL